MLPLKFLLLGLGKYIPLPISQTIWEHGVEIPVKLPDGSTSTRRAKLLPMLADLRRDWKGALKDSALALWHRHCLVRLFTNVCETVVKVILISRWLYGFTRRRFSVAYRTLSVPHLDEGDHFNKVRDLYIWGLLLDSGIWIWNSIKIWEQPLIAYKLEVLDMKKVRGWKVIKFNGWAYAVRLRKPGQARKRRTFRQPLGQCRLVIDLTETGTCIVHATDLNGRRITNQICISE